MPLDQASCQRLDQDDPLASCRSRFVLPENVIYLDGNSLGAMPRAMNDVMRQTLDVEWSQGLIESWNKAGWVDLSQTLGDKLGGLVGAAAGQIVVCDTTSSNLYKALHAACAARPERSVILTQADNFPSDLYIIDGVMQSAARTLTCERVVQAELIAAINDQVAVLVLSHINYRNGEILPMLEITAAAHRAGALVIWDLCHSAGVMLIELDRCAVDFAVGCSYKYLNAGPGAPGYIYVAERHLGKLSQPLSGWWSHAEPFAFESDYRAATDIRGFLCGTQPVLALKGVGCGLDTYTGVSLEQVAAKSRALGELFITLVREQCAEFDLELVGPEDPMQRGSQVSLRFEQGYALMQALIERGVIGDFRAPDLMRFGFAPLYIRYQDVWDAVQCLKHCLQQGVWQDQKYQHRLAVT